LIFSYFEDSVEQENNDKKTYNENIKVIILFKISLFFQKIASFVNSNSGKDKTDNKKLYSQFNVVLQSPYFNYNDIGKKAIKVLVQNKFFVRK